MKELLIQYLEFAEAEFRKLIPALYLHVEHRGKLAERQLARAGLPAFKQLLKEKLETTLEAANDCHPEEWHRLRDLLSRVYDEYVQEYICLSFVPEQDAIAGLN